VLASLLSATLIGLEGRPFTLYKFRSMRVGNGGDVEARFAGVKDDRLTRVGRLLRRTRFDELPQLWNILTEDLSLVGFGGNEPFVERFSETSSPTPPLCGRADRLGAVNYSYADSEADHREAPSTCITWPVALDGSGDLGRACGRSSRASALAEDGSSISPGPAAAREEPALGRRRAGVAETSRVKANSPIRPSPPGRRRRLPMATDRAAAAAASQAAARLMAHGDHLLGEQGHGGEDGAGAQNAAGPRPVLGAEQQLDWRRPGCGRRRAGGSGAAPARHTTRRRRSVISLLHQTRDGA
jgi:hypothetical protein